ncbi:hypothetical protein CYY_007835 [Polysphondylium violaceum]|uniref:Gamma-soluble NSF attachment protein n=1 Tax=Polysphondylium violaceum TaxID=133409 RepID=A0A8J4PRB4_9MYCE|nr:hypothetical protein CYY_007835 [Polysphondylium violaceum]
MMNTKRIEADAAMKDADKLSTKTLFRWKPDWDSASFLYEKAANGYRTAKVYDLAKYCFIRLSMCQTHMDVFYLAAKSIETAATMAKELKDTQECVRLLLEASKLYRTNGNSFQSADTMTKAAKLLEETDLDQCVQLLLDACELFELDDKDHFSGDTFKQTISMLLRHKKFMEAIDLMLLQNKVFLKLDQKHDLNKSCLSIVVISLLLDDVVGAKNKFTQFLDYTGFIHSDEGITAQELITAYDKNEADTVKKITQKHIFNFLDNQVAKIAKSLQLKAPSAVNPMSSNHNNNSFSNPTPTTNTPSNDTPVGDSHHHDEDEESVL